MRHPSAQSFETMFASEIEKLAVTLRPGTIDTYQTTVNNFLSYLRASYPKIHRLSRLRRNPHILDWLRSLHERGLKSGTRVGYIFRLRRLLDDLALSTNASLEQALIFPEDFPPLDEYLPKPLSPENDRLLDSQLRKNVDLMSYGLLLLRATGMRLGECLNLTTDCLHPLGQGQWVLRVPLGKLHNERWLPVDDDIRKMIAHILTFRNRGSGSGPAEPANFLFPKPRGHKSSCNAMRYALNIASKQAGCSAHITPHQLRHSYATEMLRVGVSLPALKELLGHKDIRMTMRYIHVSQNDLQQQYHQARGQIAHLYLIPQLPLPGKTVPKSSVGIDAIRSALDGTLQLLQMYVRHLHHTQLRHDLQCIVRRLIKVSKKIRSLDGASK